MTCYVKNFQEQSTKISGLTTRAVDVEGLVTTNTNHQIEGFEDHIASFGEPLASTTRNEALATKPPVLALGTVAFASGLLASTTKTTALATQQTR